MASVTQSSSVMQRHRSSNLLSALHQSWAFNIKCLHLTVINHKDEWNDFIALSMSRSGPSGTNGLLILVSGHQLCLPHHYHGSSSMLCSSPTGTSFTTTVPPATPTTIIGSMMESSFTLARTSGQRSRLHFGENIWAEIKNIPTKKLESRSEPQKLKGIWSTPISHHNHLPLSRSHKDAIRTAI